MKGELVGNKESSSESEASVGHGGGADNQSALCTCRKLSIVKPSREIHHFCTINIR